jgi:hypothetical protein
MLSEARLAMARRAASYTLPPSPRVIGPALPEADKVRLLDAFRERLAREHGSFEPPLVYQGCQTLDEYVADLAAKHAGDTTAMRAAFREAVDASKPELAALAARRIVPTIASKSKGQIGNAAGRAKQTRVIFSRG